MLIVRAHGLQVFVTARRIEHTEAMLIKYQYLKLARFLPVLAHSLFAHSAGSFADVSDAAHKSCSEHASFFCLHLFVLVGIICTLNKALTIRHNSTPSNPWKAVKEK